MPFEFSTGKGNVRVSYEAISTVIGVAVTETYGVVGMTSQNLKDGIKEILKKENYQKGIEIEENNGTLEINIHIIVQYGTRISEIAANVQEKAKYELEQTLGVVVSGVHIFVEDVKVSTR